MRHSALLALILLGPPACDLDSMFGEDPETEKVGKDDGVHPVDRGPGSDVSPDKVARAKVLWDTHCSGCHGKTAAGTDRAPGLGGADWNANTTDAHIRETILGGGKAATKSASMPAHPDLADDPELLGELITILRNVPDWHADPSRH